MKIIIIGGGITGLSAAWYIRQKLPEAKIILFEKTNRLGGWIRTVREQGFLFEQGPHTFQLGRSPHLLDLIQSLKLEILKAAPQKRYIYCRGKLRSIGSMIPAFIPYLIRELFVAASTKEDESIYDFAQRRFSQRLAEELFDPMTLGIYGGDIRKLSIRRCFPALYKWEREKGSVMRGMISAPKREKGLFTIKKGMQELIDALESSLDLEIHFNACAKRCNECEVLVNGEIWQANYVIDATPPSGPKQSLWVTNLAFCKDVLEKKGFGYLVPTKEGSPLLGCIFDSSIFPEQNSQNETRLTVMHRMSLSQEELLGHLRKHIGITELPSYCSSFFANDAILQFEVGSAASFGVSLEANIERAKRLVQNL